MKRQFLAIALVLLMASALADQTAQTTPQTYVSNFGRYRLTVFPLEEEGASSTHSELMVRLPPTLERGIRARCEATLERWVGNSYELVWRKPLVNEVSPESALVSAADGSFVTFDDWGRSGYGENVVVIYSGKGSVIRKFALRDLMTKEQIEKLPRTISSIHWGGHHIMEIETEKIVVLRIGTSGEWDESKQEYRDVRIKMTDGSVLPE